MQAARPLSYRIDAPLGPLAITVSDLHLLSINFLAEPAPTAIRPSRLMQKINEQLEAYFQNPHFSFSIPLALHGTAFQQRVWQALTQIPVGQSISYGELAKQLNTSARAIGQACRTNPIPIIIPCHRVVGKTNLGGFAGATDGPLFKCKQWLTQHEMLQPR